MKKVKYFSIALAEVTREICENLCEENIKKVYIYCAKIKLKSHKCDICVAETPTISDLQKNTCALCGCRKSLGARQINLVVSK